MFSFIEKAKKNRQHLIHLSPEQNFYYIGNPKMSMMNPAASFVRYFRGKHIVMINKSETKYDGSADLVIRKNIGEVFRQVMDKIEG